MKKILVLLLAAVFVMPCVHAAPIDSDVPGLVGAAPALGLSAAGELGPVVDEWVELMAIAARLAGYEECRMDTAGEYIDDIDRELGPYASHPLIVFLRDEARAKEEVAYDAVMSMAVRLTRNGDCFSLLEEDLPGLDKRWKKLDMERFLTLLSDFYRQSRFKEFFAAHAPLYEQAVAACREQVTARLHPARFEAFFGVPAPDRRRIVIGMCNGYGNYGPSRQVRGEAREVFAILGYAVGEDGIPHYGAKTVLVLVHELCHSYVNPLLCDDPDGTLCAAAGQLERSTARSMESQAYGGWQTLVNESLVRASVIRYMLDNDFCKEELQAEMDWQMDLNFRWMPCLVSALNEYALMSREYPSLADYYPELIRVFDRYATREREEVAKALTIERP